MSFINKLNSLFSKKKSYREPAGSMDIAIDQNGRLIKWTNNPFRMMERRIVSGSSDKKKLIFFKNTYKS